MLYNSHIESYIVEQRFLICILILYFIKQAYPLLPIISIGQAAFAIVIGALPLLFLPQLINNSILGLFIGCAVFLWRYHQCWSQYIAVSLLSFVWCSFSAQKIMQPIYYYATDKSVTITGRVLSANISIASASSILFLVEKVEERQLNWYQQFRVLLKGDLTVYHFQSGQEWKLKSQLRPIHSRLNQGGFDSQRWAITNHCVMSARVNNAELLNANIGLRQRIISTAAKYIRDLPTADILFALTFGERSLMNADRKNLMINTGIAHLIAISGLHVAMAGLVGFYFIRGIHYFLPTHFINSQQAYIIGWICAASYVWLAGAEPPALRTLIAMTIWLTLHKRGYLWSSWQVFIVTLAIMILCDPVTILSESTWLSCYAVFSLLFWYKLAPLSSRLKKWHYSIVNFIYLQFAITLLLSPLQIWLFHGLSWTSFAANLIAVPVITFITVPILLFALLTSPLPILSTSLWFLADKSLYFILPYLVELQIGWLAIGKSIMPISCLGWFFLVIIRLSIWRSQPILILSLLMVMLIPEWYKSRYNWRMDVLDVGHGLAIVIHNDKHAILYDTGTSWPGGNMAKQEILPYLHWHQLKLDGIIISHQDNDHLGGLNDLTHVYPQRWLYSSSVFLAGKCVAGQHFQWQGLHFDVLWPPILAWRAYNADSCVIRLTDGHSTVLLTGDLEKTQELALVSNQISRKKLSADILLTPHHGSNTSSSGPFIRAVKPSATIASVARYSPWRLPAENVYKRYVNQQIKWYDTAHSGQISVLFFDKHFEIKRYRSELMPRWYHNWFGTSRYNE